ncbi:uncharacterized protein SEPMUDRAFT_113988 [Sphaerulina musiva SO2202]|uniref:Uncharacterized protein n=1 Tax=Sphaerulina musiva (strain SO2202) TaxID=692275 RepID=N1QP23_SPHMS|nr:uncharacterized protein SEPMUDRAFT_113988 [Sphaerulina musiva SO2202]EMF18019.1 hypothetical protein SEPMUDRAFT_113988 [Sphaerulina musiva SO2202]
MATLSPQLRRHRVPEAWEFNAETAVRGLCKLRKKDSFVAARQNRCAAPVAAAQRADSKSRTTAQSYDPLARLYSVSHSGQQVTHDNDMANLSTAQYHSGRFDPTKDFIARQMVTRDETMEPLTGFSLNRCAA